MKHLEEAYNEMSKDTFKHIDLDENEVTFFIQDGPIKEVGENGLQAVDMLEFVQHLFSSLNKAYPCRENALTITKIEEAIHWQTARTTDREKRNVEGTNAV